MVLVSSVINNRLGVAALGTSHLLSNRFSLTTCIPAAFLVYEYMITFQLEVDLFWKTKVTGAVVLFFLNRYIVLVTSLLAVSGVVIDFTASVRVCKSHSSGDCSVLVPPELRARDQGDECVRYATIPTVGG